VSEIHILGATGRREDHTVGNLGLLMEYTRLFDLDGIRVDIVSDYSTAFAVTDSCELHVGAGRRVSLFSPDNSLTIKSSGLQWPTDAVVFDNWWPATLNRAVDDVIKLTFSHPSRALILLD
jgi:thiamine pyrophosphokinase